MNKNKKSKSNSVKFTQRGCVTTNAEAAKDMLDYRFNGIGYIYHFGSFWAVYAV